MSAISCNHVLQYRSLASHWPCSCHGILQVKESYKQDQLLNGLNKKLSKHKLVHYWFCLDYHSSANLLPSRMKETTLLDSFLSVGNGDPLELEKASSRSSSQKVNNQKVNNNPRESNRRLTVGRVILPPLLSVLS